MTRGITRYVFCAKHSHGHFGDRKLDQAPFVGVLILAFGFRSFGLQLCQGKLLEVTKDGPW